MRTCTLARLTIATTCITTIIHTAPATAQTPEEFLDRIEAIGEPRFDPARKHEPGYLDNYKHQQHILYRQKAALLLECARRHADDPRVPEWINRRWVLLGWNQDPADVADEVLADIQAVLADLDEIAAPKHHSPIRRDAAYWHAHFQTHKHAGDPQRQLEHITRFVDAWPDDDRGAALLDVAAADPSLDRDRRVAIYRRIAEQYPDTHHGRYAPGMVRRLEAIGQPFDLTFTDLTTGRRITTADLRGRVVVIDFWATTCPPCVAAMPHLKKLYEEYRHRGVAFIGVSLDAPAEDGGLRALRAFIDEHDIPWPQYYQGSGYDSEFSRSWGVGSAPTVFLLDRQGRLRHTNAHDRLGDLIPQLLNEPQ